MKHLTSELHFSAPKPRITNNARAKIRDNNKEKKIIVLDDDPTGCQTVQGIHVLLQWDDSSLKKAITKYSSFYILHNTRSLSNEAAFALNKEISKSLLKYIPKQQLTIISRSDSTLRGHFLSEVTALQEMTGPYDGVLVVPYFREGGRLTLNDEHYVEIGKYLIPASETEFAMDPVFGFSTSNIPEWIEEKTHGLVKADTVISISIEDIRADGIDKVKNKLSSCANGQFACINALQDEDLEIVILAIQELETSGMRFLFRSAASLVKIFLGLEDPPLWQPGKKGKRGVIIAGSHVSKTSAQLKKLIEAHKLHELELSIQHILQDEHYFAACSKIINTFLLEEQTVLIYTERKYQLAGSDEERLIYGRKISDFLSSLINHIEIAPDFIVAKGGITSNDVAKYGLEIIDAEVLGQIQPGIPVWQPSVDSKFPNCIYVVFPGNVGGDDSLKHVYEILT